MSNLNQDFAPTWPSLPLHILYWKDLLHNSLLAIVGESLDPNSDFWLIIELRRLIDIPFMHSYHWFDMRYSKEGRNEVLEIGFRILYGVLDRTYGSARADMLGNLKTKGFSTKLEKPREPLEQNYLWMKCARASLMAHLSGLDIYQGFPSNWKESFIPISKCLQPFITNPEEDYDVYTKSIRFLDSERPCKALEMVPLTI